MGSRDSIPRVHITLSLHFRKPKVPIFVRKCYTALNFAPKGPYGHRKDCRWTQTQCLNVLVQKYRITVPKVSIDMVYTIPLLFTKKIFLTCFDFKITYLGPNEYPRLVLAQKRNFSLDLKHKIFLAFWKTKSTYFFSKRIVSTQKELYLDQNIVLKCFETKIFYYGFKGFCWLRLYDSFTFYSKLFPHMFWLQNLSFGSKWLPLACFGHKMKFWFEFEV